MSSTNGQREPLPVEDQSEVAVIQLIRDILRRPRRRPARLVITITTANELHIEEGTPRGKFKHGPVGD